MPNANNKLADYSAAHLQNALVTNPTAQYFPWNCSDYPYATYPLGIPRANVLLAYNQKLGSDLASVATGGKGANMPVLYAPGIAGDIGVIAPSDTLAQVQTSNRGGTPVAAIAGTGGGGALLQAAPVMTPGTTAPYSGTTAPIITVPGQVV
jgi:hypothetical protein